MQEPEIKALTPEERARKEKEFEEWESEQNICIDCGS